MPCVPLLSDGCHHYKAACVPSTVCDEQCQAVDAGKTEAHAPHEPIPGPADVAPECR